MLLRVMTFNLLYAGAVNPAGGWPMRLPLALDVLKSGAEIIGLQEATERQIEDIMRELPDFKMVAGPQSGETRLSRLMRTAVGSLRRTGSSGASAEAAEEQETSDYRGEYCAILYRASRFEAIDGSAFWLSHLPHHPGSALRGTWLPRVVNWVRLRDRNSLREITVYNAHLDFLPWAPARAARILRDILDSHWDGSAQILTGDFNAVRHSSAYRTLCRASADRLPPLADAWLEAAERIGPEGTYHGGTGRARWPGRLDRIFCRPAPQVERAVTVTHHHGRIFPSDHFPVVAEIRFHSNDPVGSC